MSYRRPYAWEPRYRDVPMLGDSVLSVLDSPILAPVFIIGAVLGGLALAGAATSSPRRNPRRRRRRTSRARSSRRSSRRRTTRRPSARRRRTTRRRRSSRRTSRSGLSKARRQRIARSKFVFPERRAWPLDTKRRARAAISYRQMGRVASASDFNKIRSKLIRDWPDVWAEYGRGKVTWSKVKRAKARRKRSRSSRSASRRRAA